MTHELKTDPIPFCQIVERQKHFEIRINDRGYAVGDTLLLRETESTEAAMAMNPLIAMNYTGRQVAVIVTQLLNGPAYGLPAGFVCMSIEEVHKPDPEPTFERELSSLINRYSKENGSDTPDWILAKYLCDCLGIWNVTVARRREYYGDYPKTAGTASLSSSNTPEGEK